MTQPALPPEDQPDGAPIGTSRIRDAALILPLAGLALFSPPLISLFVSDNAVFGVPMIIVYIFTIWAALIVGARLLARRLTREDLPDDAG